MAERLGEALLELGTDDRKLKRGLSGAEKTTRKSVAKIQKIFAGLVTAAAAASFARSLEGTVTRIDAIGKQAAKLGLTVEALQEMRFAAELSGVAITTFDMAFQRFTRRAGEAANETGEAKKALASLGVTLDDLRSKNPEELFTQVAAALAEIGNAGQQLALAQKIFDSEGVALVNMVANLEALRQKARDLGIVLSGDLVRGATRMKDELSTILAVLTARFDAFKLNWLEGLDLMFNFTGRPGEDAIFLKSAQLKKSIKGLELAYNGLTDAQKQGAAGADLSAGLALLRGQLAGVKEQTDAISALEVAGARAAALAAAAGGGGGGGTATDAELKKRKATVDGILQSIEDQIQAVGEQTLAFEMQGGALAENIALKRADIELRREGVTLTSQESDMLKLFASDLRASSDELIAAAAAFDAAEDAAREYQLAVEDIAAEIVGPLRNAFTQGEISFRSLADSLMQIGINLRNRLINEVFDKIEQAIANLGKGGSGGSTGGILGSIAGAAVSAFGGGGGGSSAAFPANTGQLTGFAHGGNFTVGGRGGVDQNLVQFNASRGERVSVTPAGQGGGPVIQVINNTPMKTREERGTGPRGEDVRRFIIDEVGKAMAGGEFDAQQRSRFGRGATVVQR